MRIRRDPLLRVENETEIMLELKHPCIVELFDVVNVKDEIYIDMDFLEGGSLDERIQSKLWLPEIQAKVFFTKWQKRCNICTI